MKPLVTHPNMIIEEHARGLLVVRLRGEGDDATVNDAFALWQPLLEERAPATVVIDGRGFAGLAMSARWRLAMRMKVNRPLIKHTYVFGLSDLMTFVTRVIIRASGRQNVELVSSEREALERAAGSAPSELHAS